MVVTMLTSDAEGNVPDAEDCQDWADQFATDHPVLSDEVGFSMDVMREGEGYPFYMLLDNGLRIKKVASGAEAISSEEVIAEIEHQ